MLEKNMKTYAGDRTIDGVDVRVNGAPLNPREDLKRFSDAGFEWTYEGSGPLQLSLAILADHLQDDSKAIELCEPFMKEIVANFANEWAMTSDDVAAALEALVG